MEGHEDFCCCIALDDGVKKIVDLILDGEKQVVWEGFSTEFIQRAHSALEGCRRQGCYAHRNTLAIVALQDILDHEELAESRDASCCNSHCAECTPGVERWI